MAFWGVEVKNGDPFTHRFDVERGRLHISQATLGDGSSTKRSLVQCKVGSRKPILMCSLLPDKAESCPLDLEFEEVDDVVFSVVGPRSVHLTGYYLGNGTCGHYDDSDSYGEDIAGTETEESTDYDTEEEYDDDFIDDGDLEVFPPSPIPNSGVVIEEIFDDEKPLKENGSSKHIKKPRPGDSDDSNNSQQQIVVKGSTGVPVLESEDEDGFPISSPSKSNSIVQNTEEVKEKREKREKRSIKEGKKKKKKTKDDGDQGSSLKRKIESVVQDGNPESGAGQPYDLSVPSTDVNSESNVKPKKKKKEPANKGKILEAGKDSKCSFPKEDIAQAEEVKADNMDHYLPVSNELEQELPVDKSLVVNDDHAAAATPQSGEKKKKKKKKNKIQETDMEVLVKEESDTDVKASQVRTFPNGLVIEELAMGKPDGKRASPGKKVAVHYIGKLKKNGQIFDSNIGKAPFKFRLGVGQVIKGWDVGVNGMRIGDKRRLTIPPSMGYGSQGAGKKIPPNSWLLFDVELVDANN